MQCKVAKYLLYPIEDTVSFQFFQNVQTTPSERTGELNTIMQLNLSFLVSPNGKIDINAGNYTPLVNITNVSSTPSAPQGFEKLYAYSVSVYNTINVSEINLIDRSYNVQQE